MVPSPGTHLHTASARWQRLDFDLDLPAGWQVELPEQDAIDFDLEPARMQSLLQARSADGSLRLDIGARPHLALLPLVYSATYYSGERGLMPIDDVDEAPFGTRSASVGIALHGEGTATQIVRHAYLADGDRVIELLLRGPQFRATELLTVWQQLEHSFRLHHPHGETEPPEAADAALSLERDRCQRALGPAPAASNRARQTP